jgi:hypothetical protein
MLQPSDEIYIGRVVMPNKFKLVNGQVIVEIPDGLAYESRDDEGRKVRKPFQSPFSQEFIEKRVNDMKRLEKRAEMAANFPDEMALLDEVLRQTRQRKNSDDLEDARTDPEIGPWLAWRDEMLAQCEKVAKLKDVKRPKWPKFPKEHRHNSDSRELAKRVGHDDAR